MWTRSLKLLRHFLLIVGLSLVSTSGLAIGEIRDVPGMTGTRSWVTQNELIQAISLHKQSDGFIFLSYAHDDERFALKLAESLTHHGLKIWVDQWNIQKGADWDQAIEDALEACSAMLVILSPSAVASAEVRAEVRTAIEDNKNIVPVLYRDCRIPRRLRLLNYLDYRHESDDHLRYPPSMGRANT